MAKVNLPVWLYWEGPKPAWIEECTRTIFRHGRDVRLLGPAEWDDLRREDRDVSLSHLCPAHKSDVARAYLLSRYGGLWLDSDCIAFRNLQPVLDLLDEYDFVTAPQHDQQFSCAFAASRPGGVIASSWYRRQMAVLRGGEEIQWLSLTSDALSHAIGKTQHPWYRIRHDVVEPVWWNDPDAFLTVRSDDDHVRHLNPVAYAYMLSNNTIQGSGAAAHLMQEGSFFRFLLRCSEMNVGASPLAVVGNRNVGD